MKASKGRENIDSTGDDSEKEFFENWSEDDLKMLFSRILEQVPENDELSFRKRTLNWSEISFSKFSSNVCESKWREIIGLLLQYRTTKEMVKDASRRLKGNRLQFRTSRPKPASYLYLEDVRGSVSAKNPTWSAPQITKYIMEQYKILPDDEKKLYQEKYQALLKKYKEKERRQKKHPTIQTPVILYIEEKTKKHLKKHPEVDEKTIKKQYREKFHQLSDRKKLPYIEMALEAEPQYQEESKEYCNLHPGYKPPNVRCLNKAENDIKMLSMGKPRVTGNAYNYFIQDFRKETNSLGTTFFTEASKKWKHIDVEIKESYKHIAAEAKKKYAADYKEYLSKLTQEERDSLETKKLKQKVSSPISRQKTKKRKTKFPNQPKKPPTSLYLFYSSLQLRKNHQIPPKERMKYISGQFKELNEQKKSKYSRKLEKEVKKYSEKLAKFKATLTFDELRRFEAELQGKFESDTDTEDKEKKLQRKRKVSESVEGSSLPKKKAKKKKVSQKDEELPKEKHLSKATEKNTKLPLRELSPVSSSDESSDQDAPPQTVPNKTTQPEVRKKKKKKKKSMKKSTSSSDNSSSDDEPLPPIIVNKLKKNQKTVKKSSSSSDESSSDDPLPPMTKTKPKTVSSPKKNNKQIAEKKSSSSTNDSSSDDDTPLPPHTAKQTSQSKTVITSKKSKKHKPLAESSLSSSEESSSESEPEHKTKLSNHKQSPVKKLFQSSAVTGNIQKMATANNKESSGESSSSESDAQPPAKVQKISVQAQQQIKDRLKTTSKSVVGIPVANSGTSSSSNDGSSSSDSEPTPIIKSPTKQQSPKKINRSAPVIPKKVPLRGDSGDSSSEESSSSNNKHPAKPGNPAIEKAKERWTSTPNAATDKSRIPLHTPIQTQNLSSVQPRPSFSDSGTSSSSSEDEQAVKKTKKKLKLLKKRVKKSSSSSSSSSDEAISPTQSRKQLHAIVRKTTMEEHMKQHSPSSSSSSESSSDNEGVPRYSLPGSKPVPTTQTKRAKKSSSSSSGSGSSSSGSSSDEEAHPQALHKINIQSKCISSSQKNNKQNMTKSHPGSQVVANSHSSSSDSDSD